MCPKWNCMLAAAVLALAFIFLPADVFNKANSFAYYVTSYGINDHGGDVIRGDRGDLSFPDRSWSRQGVKMNSTQRPEQSRTRLSVFLHLFFALSYVFMAAFTGLALLRFLSGRLPAARFLLDLMARQKKDGKKRGGRPVLYMK